MHKFRKTPKVSTLKMRETPTTKVFENEQIWYIAVQYNLFQQSFHT